MGKATGSGDWSDRVSAQIYQGIPTEYRHTRFRSRLEARWAVFFDALGWGWAYEPFDLAGYIPDFVLAFDGGELLVEVKPCLVLAALYDHRQRVIDSGWQGEAMIVGADLFEPEHVHPIVGIIGERQAVPVGPFDAELDGIEWQWDQARLFACSNCGGPSVLAESGSWHCRVCGADCGHIGTLSKAREAWAEAANRVQWRAA